MVAAMKLQGLSCASTSKIVLFFAPTPYFYYPPRIALSNLRHTLIKVLVITYYPPKLSIAMVLVKKPQINSTQHFKHLDPNPQKAWFRTNCL